MPERSYLRVECTRTPPLSRNYEWGHWIFRVGGVSVRQHGGINGCNSSVVDNKFVGSECLLVSEENVTEEGGERKSDNESQI